MLLMFITNRGCIIFYCLITSIILSFNISAQTTANNLNEERDKVIDLYLKSGIQGEENNFDKQFYDVLIKKAACEGGIKLILYAEVFKTYYMATRQKTLTDAEKILVSSQHRFNKSGYNEIAGTFNFFAGKLYYNNHNFQSAFHHFVIANDYLERAGYKNYPLTQKVASDLFGFYYNFEDYTTALKYVLLAVKYPENKLSKAIFDLNNLGVTYHKLKDITEAKETFKKVIEMARQTNDSVWLGIGSGNYGNMLRLEGKYSQSLPYLYMDVVCNKYAEPASAAITSIYVANSLMKCDSVAKAKFYVDLGYTLHQPWNAISFFRHYYENKALYFKLTGQYKLASLYQDSLLRLNDSLRNVYSSHVSLLTDIKFKEEALRTEKRRLTAEAASIKKIRNLIIILLTVVFIIALYLVHKRQQEQKKLYLKRKEEAEKKLEAAQHELDIYLRDVKEKTQIIEQIENSLAGVETEHLPTNGASYSTVDPQIKQLLDSVLLTDDNWHKFKHLFNQIWPGFFGNLLQLYPDLTQGDLRLLALYKLKLPSKDMAKMLGISLDSLRKSRYRLRKKHPKLLGDDRDSLQL